MKIINTCLSILFVSLFLFSCRKAEGPDLRYSIAKPSNLSLNLDKTTITASWDYAPNDQLKAFVAQIAYDENFTNIIKSDTVDATVNAVTFSNLGYFSQAYVRVKTLSKDIVLNSEFVQASVVPENIFKSVVRADLTVNSATLKWNDPATGSVTKVLIISASDNEEEEIVLTSSDISSKSVNITNLVSAETYTAVIFDGEERKGVVTFTTIDINAAISIEGSSTIYETLQEAINAAANDAIINVGGAQYDFSSSSLETITISNKSLTIRAKPNATSTPQITFKNFNLIGNVGYFKISGIKLISTSNSQTGTNTDYNKHIVGVTYVTSPVSVEITDCDISGAMSGLIFSQTVGAASATTPVPGTATFNLVVNNCLLHDFGNAGGDFIDFRSGTIGKITYTNNTLYNAARAFLRTDNTATGTASTEINISNCTFNNICNGGAFIRVAAPYSILTMSNCIVSNKLSSNNNTISGTETVVKYNDNNFSGSFSANFTNLVTTANNVNSTSLDPQFVDANNGDFTLGNATLKANSLGDPRWL